MTTTTHAPLSSDISAYAPITVQDKLRLFSKGWSAYDLNDLASTLALTVEFAKNVVETPDVELIEQARAWVGGDLSVRGKSQAEQVARLMTSKFWRRTLRRTVWRAAEAAYLKKGAVGGQTGTKYVSDFTSKIKRQMDEQQAEWLAASRVEATIDGELVSLQLAELHDKNEKARLAEFLAWSNGFQKLVTKAGLEIGMCTLTLEGEFHPNPKHERKNDKQWNGINPALANLEIGERWAQIRSSLLQHGITLSGFRSSEPMQDATPHWHMIIAYPPDQRGRVMCEIMKLFDRNLDADGKFIDGKLKLRKGKAGATTYFDTPDEALSGTDRPAQYEGEGAQVDLTIVDTSGGANANALVNYIMKYVPKFGMKRTQFLVKKLKEQQAEIGFELESATGQVRAEIVQKLDELAAEILKLEDEEEKEDGPERHLVSAWRSCWGVRGLQWFGIRKALTPWRELRRLNEKRFVHQGIERALWNRARAGDVEGFLGLLGGLMAAPISKQASCRSKMSPRTNQFGQTVTKIIGVVVHDEVKQTSQEVITRPYQWTLITEWPADAIIAVPAAIAAPVPVPIQSVDIYSILPGFDDQTIQLITLIPNAPSKPKTSKSKAKNPAVEIKPTPKPPKPPDRQHWGAQNAASP